MRLRLAMSAMSRSAMTMPSPSVSGGARSVPSGETMAVKQPPRSALLELGVAGDLRTCASVSQPVALTTKQPDSSAWWRIVTSICSRRCRRPASRGTARRGSLRAPPSARSAPAGCSAPSRPARRSRPTRVSTTAKPGPVALPPDHALVVRRRDLARRLHQPPVGVEQQLRVVERAVVALVDADRHHRAAPGAPPARLASTLGPGTATACSSKQQVLGADARRAALMNEKYG